MALIFWLDNGRWDLTWKDKAVNNWDMLSIRKSSLSLSFCWLDMILICISCNLERACAPPTHSKHMRLYWFNGFNWRRMPVRHHNDKNHPDNYATILLPLSTVATETENVATITYCHRLSIVQQSLFSWRPISWSIKPFAHMAWKRNSTTDLVLYTAGRCQHTLCSSTTLVNHIKL